MGACEDGIEGMVGEDVDEREERRHDGLSHEVPEPDHGLQSGDAGDTSEHGEPQDESGTEKAQVEQPSGRRRRRLGPHQGRRHRSDHHDGDDWNGHGRPKEPEEHGIHDPWPGEPLDEVVGEPEDEEGGHRQHQHQTLNDQGGE